MVEFNQVWAAHHPVAVTLGELYISCSHSYGAFTLIPLLGIAIQQKV